ncbi:MAG TPA: hypothetical protein VKH82_02875 [Candidatus Binatia bacterium]|nr:hypothetical protein [Candidatus Binatia bacterium]
MPVLRPPIALDAAALPLLGHPGDPDYFPPGYEPCTAGLTEVPMLRLIAVTVLLASGVASPGSVAHAQEARNSNHAVYLQYCSACHAPEGKGDGVLAAHLTPKPTDLTQLAKQSGGEFNAVVVYDAISGRPPPGHGTSAMPVWGETMPEAPGNEDLRANKLRIAKIVNYLRSIQVQ